MCFFPTKKKINKTMAAPWHNIRRLFPRVRLWIKPTANSTKKPGICIAYRHNSHNNRILLSTMSALALDLDNSRKDAIEYPDQSINDLDAKFADVVFLKNIKTGSKSVGYQFKIAYIDTRPKADSSCEGVVLCVHGTPGSHEDFREIINYFDQKNVRVVCVNFPGFGLTSMDKTDKFNHGNDERTQFLLDFLNHVNVKKIDLLVSHSSGLFPTMKIMAEHVNMVRTVAILNPAPTQVDRVIQPFWLLKYLIYVARMHGHVGGVFSDATKALLVYGLQKYGTNKVDKDIAAVWMESMLRTDFPNFPSNLEKMIESRKPCLVMIGLHDRLVPRSQNEHTAKLFGLNATNTVKYAGEAGHDVIKSGADVSFCDGERRLMIGAMFDSGTHFTFKKFSPQTTELLWDLFTRASKHTS